MLRRVRQNRKNFKRQAGPLLKTLPIDVSSGVADSDRLSLLAQAETFDDLAIPIRIAAIQVIEQPAAFIHHHNQAAPGRVILHVCPEMRCQIVDALAQQSDLHFRRACVLDMGPILLDQP